MWLLVTMVLTFWSMYLLSSIADRLEWSHDEEEADGRLLKRQQESCCWRSINCFIKLSLCKWSRHTWSIIDEMEQVMAFCLSFNKAMAKFVDNKICYSKSGVEINYQSNKFRESFLNLGHSCFKEVMSLK